jgi:hypothetical protein
MKKVINYFLGILAAGGLSYAASAQELSQNTKERNLNESFPVDSTRNQRMENDLNKRNLLTKNEKVTWKYSGVGYNGTYTSNHVQYMAQYDLNGKYLETLTKKEWNDNVQEKLRSAYDQSIYKNQKVTGYWEVTDPIAKGYYLELNDNQNKPSQVWINENGNISSSPYRELGMKRNRDMYLVPEDSTMKKDH